MSAEREAPVIRQIAGMRARLDGAADGFGAIAAVARLAVRPTTWRRPVRVECLRVLDALARCTGLTVAAAALVGISLVGQGFYWTERAGDEVDLAGIIARILVREIAVVATALLLIGRVGLGMLNELRTLTRSGVIRQYARQGVDPFLMLVLPRMLAFPAMLFCQALLFLLVAFAVGYLLARGVGVTTDGTVTFMAWALAAIGDHGALILPVKALVVGVATATVLCVLGLAPQAADRGLPTRYRSSFGPLMLAAVLANVVVSLSL